MPDHTAVLANRLLDQLPQTQCTKCGYPNCRAYAEAMATGEAGYNQCPPGGQEGVARLAQVLDQPIVALNPELGIERPRAVAYIDEARCIGCTLCIQACPVDAIVGAPKQMHTILAADCTGCDLCIAPCPVDCISLLPVTGTVTGWAAWSPEQAHRARAHYARRTKRRESIQKRTTPPFNTQQILTSHTKLSDQTKAVSTMLLQLPIDTRLAQSRPSAELHKQALLQAILKRAEQKKQ